MQNALCRPPFFKRRTFTKTLLIMKMTAFILLAGSLQLSAKGLTQGVTITKRNAPLQEVFKDIEKQTGYQFFYKEKVLDGAKPVTIDLRNANIEQALQVCFKDQKLAYNIVDKIIVVRPKETVDLQSADNSLSQPPPPIVISGRVSDKDGKPLEGASVLVKGTKNGTTTDVTGFFSLKNVSAGDQIIISYSGYQSQTLKIGGKTSFNIFLEVSQNPLDQVQIVAYGQTTQRLSVGNTATVTAKQIEEQPVQNVLMALEGQVPGLMISQSTGMPGSGIQVSIQGPNSIRNGNDPFYVVDGVPFVSENLSTTLGTQVGHSGLITVGAYGNPLNYINPDDIESISVLKDADATAIYGSQAANGAVLITTKKGRPGQTQINVNLQQGIGLVAHFMPLLNTQQYLQMRRQAFKNDNVGIPFFAINPNDFNYDIDGFWDQNRYTDWQKVLIGGTAHYSDFEGSVSGGTVQTTYMISGTYNRQTSVFPGNYADQRGALHFSLNTTSANERFRLQLTASYMGDKNQLPQTDWTSTALSLAPNSPALYTSNGALNWAPLPTGANSWSNPLGGVFYSPYQNLTNNLIGNLTMGYHILPGLDIRISGGYVDYRYNELSQNEAERFPLYSVLQLGNNARNAQYSYNSDRSWIVEPQAEYKHNWGNSNFDALVGVTSRQRNSNGTVFNGKGYTSDALLSDPAAAAALTSSASQATYKYSAAFGRLNYNYNDKYVVEGSARRDGSSRFGPANEFHDFWSVGLGWIFTEENFIKNHFSWLSYGKLKGSYGTTGNDQIGDYQYLNLYSTSGQPAVPYQGISVLNGGGLPNPNLQWENTYKLQGGIELGFFRDRILASVEYVHNRSSNELYFTPLPSITGFTGTTENLPFSVFNKSWEFTLRTTIAKTNKFNWSSNFNLTIPKYSIGENSLTQAQLGILHPIGNIPVYRFAGVDPATGVYQFYNTKGQLTQTPASMDQTAFVNPYLPTLYGGFTNSFRYRRLSLDVFFQYVRQIKQDYAVSSQPGTVFQNLTMSMLNSWQRPGDIVSTQRFNQDFSLFTQSNDLINSTGNYSDASYLRLKNVSLGYDLPSKWAKHIKMKSMHVYLQGQNLLTFTHYAGLDPETAPAIGGGTQVLPPLRIITAGIRMSL